jgi:SAM-dependent methyltransferase
MNAAEYVFEPHTFDMAACIGATFIWDGFRPTLHRLKDAIRPNGKLVVGEAHWLTTHVPPEFAKTQPEFCQEHELLQMAHAEQLEFEFVVRASHDDWDHYEASNWRGLLRWLEENPQHPNHAEVLEHLHSSQNEYLRYGRAYLGWAMYVLRALGPYQT